MSSSVFNETPSARPSGADGDSNLVVVYSKNGISFDERAIENIMEEKSISSISVVRLTSPTPSMVDQEETERLEELERFLEATTDREESDAERESDNESQSGADELASEKDHVTGDDNENTGGENNDDSTETETEVPKVKKRPGRKPKPKKQKKKRKPKERPQIVGLSVEQFYVENSADMVIKNALKLAGLSIFKRTPESDALLEIIRNDHNYTPFTSPEQMKAQKTAEKLMMERQMAQGRKFIVQTQTSTKVLNTKKRFQVVPLGSQVPPTLQQQVPRQLQQLPRPLVAKPLPQPQPTSVKPQQHIIVTGPRPVRNAVKVISPAEDVIEDDEDANSSATAEEENAETEELSEPSDESRETDNDRDSDIDFKMNNSRSSTKRKRIKKLSRRSHAQSARGQAVHTPKTTPVAPAQQQFPNLKRRKEQAESTAAAPAIGQIVQLNTKAPSTVIALGRGIQSTSFLKMRPSHKTLPIANQMNPELNRICTSTVASKVRRTPLVQVGRVVSTPTQPQEVKEIIINKNLSSPKGVFTNLNSLLAENNNATLLTTGSLDPGKQRTPSTPGTPKSSLNTAPSAAQAAASSKGFMPIGVETATSHKLPAQIVIETHQSSSELAAENDKQLDLINSIVQDELLKASLVEQPAGTADETIPKLAKMLESSAARLNQVTEPSVDIVDNSLLPQPQAAQQPQQQQPQPPQQQQPQQLQQQNFSNPVDNIDIASARLLETPDEDEITADFLQHVVGLIEEDKQFEAEVVKQVLASTETGLDAIANAVASPIFETASQLSTITQPQMTNEFPANIVTSALASLPMASSTPARSSMAPLAMSSSRPEVKVVRGNGRVFYLPPIEAPTTRAKRRAQNFPSTSSTMSDISNISLGEPMHDTSQLTNSSTESESFLGQIPGGVGRKHMSRDSAGGVRRPRRSNKLDVSQANDAEASESQEDDDDPNKLWCICRQPHNNRFMICCDLCEDWYHGTCVSVTKAMGLEMEQKGIDWKCPKCVKRQEEKSQPRITDMLLPKQTVEPQESVTLPKQPSDNNTMTESQDSTHKRPLVLSVTVPPSSSLPLVRPQKRPHPKPMHQQQLQFIKLGGNTVTSNTSDAVCVVCKRPARANSVYCSADCIRKYAQSAIQAQTVAKGPAEPAPQLAAQTSLPSSLDAKKNKKKDLFEDMLRQADSVSKVERINVFERRTGRAITGHMAPSAQQLKKWLQDNPSFEVVQPGSIQAMEIEVCICLHKKKIYMLICVSTNLQKRQAKRTTELSSPEPTSTNPSLATPVQKPAEVLGRSAQQMPATANAVKKEKSLVKPTIQQRKGSPERNSERSVSKSQPEPIRLNVRRTLKEQLMLRIKEAQAAAPSVDNSEWLSETEVEHFVKRVESEMYHSFGRDVSAKYKLKYRSLMFNIKDRKNKTLFEKICAKQVEPKQLVRMTPAELASQELAKWREEENRHQLDMIKKSELDLLSCAQNYVVKTHKGEEVIETKLDVTLPDEQVEQESNKEVLDSSDSKKSSQSNELSFTADVSSKELEADRSNAKEKPSKSIKRDKDRERDKHRNRSHKNHHQSAAKRSRSRSSSRGRSIEKRSHKKHHQDQDRDKDKEQLPRDKPPSKERAEKIQSPLPKKSVEKKAAEPALAFSLIDQILESEKTVEQAANLVQPMKQTLKSLPATPKTSAKASPPLNKYERYVQSLPSPALWTGNVHMVDVTEFNVVIHSVLGDTSQLGKLLPTNLDVIGRIARINVWDYLKKIKKSPTKEIVIVNLFPASASDTINFESFFEYLDTRQRLGVLGADSEQIRDFYIFPLGGRDKLPTVLQSTENVPFYEDAQRPNTLLGIIVRCLPNRLSNLSQTLPLPLPTASNKTPKASNKTRARTTFTPPSSPKRKHSTHSTSSKDEDFDIDAIIKAPIAKMNKTNAVAESRTSLDDQNAPYSPGGSSDESDDLTAPITTNKNELERKVNEINKQIAAQRMEIAGLLNVEPSVSYSERLSWHKPNNTYCCQQNLNKPSSSSNVLASISIPPNLTRILASLKENSESNVITTSGTTANDEEYNPEEDITTNNAYGMSKCECRETLHYLLNVRLIAARTNPEGTAKSKSRLAQLSEAELLSMVPDDLVDLPPKPSTWHEEPPPPGV
ncbi:hypothetical protein KR222_002912 [Zaprionus bogoriensis]|nr:hypothetical protein KR222_002912 [Zaprionus bogoriensis]